MVFEHGVELVIKSAKVPRENMVPEMADPLVMYERVKAICFSSVS